MARPGKVLLSRGGSRSQEPPGQTVTDPALGLRGPRTLPAPARRSCCTGPGRPPRRPASPRPQPRTATARAPPETCVTVRPDPSRAAPCELQYRWYPRFLLFLYLLVHIITNLPRHPTGPAARRRRDRLWPSYRRIWRPAPHPYYFSTPRHWRTFGAWSFRHPRQPLDRLNFHFGLPLAGQLGLVQRDARPLIVNSTTFITIHLKSPT